MLIHLAELLDSSEESGKIVIEFIRGAGSLKPFSGQFMKKIFNSKKSSELFKINVTSGNLLIIRNIDPELKAYKGEVKWVES